MKKLNDALREYKEMYLNVYMETYNSDSAIIENADYLMLMRGNLEDNCFSEEEISGIVMGQMDKETAYKFMAYFISLDDSYNNMDSLKDVIKNKYDWSLDDFTEEELNNILKYGKKFASYWCW